MGKLPSDMVDDPKWRERIYWRTLVEHVMADSLIASRLSFGQRRILASKIAGAVRAELAGEPKWNPHQS